MTTIKEVVNFLIEKEIDFRIVNSAYPYGVIAIQGEVFTEVLRELINTFPVNFERDKDIMLYIPFDELEDNPYERGDDE